MISVKSAREIEIMRRGGKVTAHVLSELAKSAAPGMTTDDLDRQAKQLIADAGGIPTFLNYRGYPKHLCASVNEEVVHGIPGPRVLREGDLLSLDMGVTIDGYVTDSALTIPIGDVSEEAERLMRVTQECLMLGIAQMKVGKRLGDIGHAVQTHAEKYGFGVVRNLVGHGIGKEMHEEPYVPNFGTAGAGLALREGLVLAVEPMITAGDYEVETLEDGWTIVTEDRKWAAHFEHTIAITAKGPRILTLRPVLEHPDAAQYTPEAEIAA